MYSGPVATLRLLVRGAKERRGMWRAVMSRPGTRCVLRQGAAGVLPHVTFSEQAVLYGC